MPSPIAIATMDFSEAIQALIDGNRIHKLEWEDKEYFGVLRADVLHLHKPDGKYYTWTISGGDLIGTDWIVLDN